MISIGINFGYHDSSICVVKDGEILFFSEEDRFTYLKHDSNFPTFATQYALQYLNLKVSDIDIIIFSENPYKKFLSRLDTLISKDLFSFSSFLNFSKKWLGNQLWSINKIANHFNFPIEKIQYIDHHYAHHLSAIKQAPSNFAVSLVIDAVGQDESISIYYENTEIHKVSQENSICYLYSLITHWLGFSPNSSECTTMALSSFGESSYDNLFEELITFKDGEILLNKNLIHLDGFNFKRHIKQIIKIFGSPRNPNQKLELSCFDSGFEANKYADIAKSLQKRFEFIIGEYINYHTRGFDTSNLCVSGGGAQNCKLIRYIREHTKFKKIFIPQAPGDAGLSIGAALSAFDSCIKKQNFFLGSDTHSEELIDIVDKFPAKFLTDLSKETELAFCELSIEKIDNEDVLINICAEEINSNKIMALIRGRSEIGPRALGSRSLIARCDDVEIAKKISTHIKKRANYRPYAVSLTFERAVEVLQEKNLDSTFFSMQTDALIEPFFRKDFAGAIHIDGTTRPQVVTAEHSFYFKLISKVQNQAVLNTSLNESGYPLCKSAKEAFLFFLKTPIDIMVLDNYILRKK